MNKKENNNVCDLKEAYCIQGDELKILDKNKAFY